MSPHQGTALTRRAWFRLMFRKMRACRMGRCLRFHSYAPCTMHHAPCPHAPMPPPARSASALRPPPQHQRCLGCGSGGGNGLLLLWGRRRQHKRRRRRGTGACHPHPDRASEAAQGEGTQQRGSEGEGGTHSEVLGASAARMSVFNRRGGTEIGASSMARTSMYLCGIDVCAASEARSERRSERRM